MSDRTWNPITGCTKVSPGCDHCYIERTPPFRMDGRRFACPRCSGTGRVADVAGLGFTAPCVRCNGAGRTGGVGDLIDVRLHYDRLEQPLRWRKPRRVFVNSLSDLFHRTVPDFFIAQVFATMAMAPGHTFQVLTKRTARMRSLLDRPDFVQSVREYADLIAVEHRRDADFPWPLPNVWLGVSVENQEWADKRIPLLLETPAAVRFLSCEPLLGAVNLADYVDRLGDDDEGECDWGYCNRPAVSLRRDTKMAELAMLLVCAEHRGIDWVICGGESGPGSRPMHPAWVRGLRDQCVTTGVPFFFKQWGEWGYKRGLTWRRDEPIGPKTMILHASAGGGFLQRVGKKAAGRELDGRTWDEYPGGAS